MEAPATAVLYQYQRESVAELWDELAPLLEAHYREIAIWHDIALDPDREIYERIEALGQLRVYTVRADRRLIGYAVFFVRPNLHYRQSVWAQQDVVFVAPEHRHRGVGQLLLAFAEGELRVEGVQVVVHHVKLAHPQLGAVLQQLGYEPAETIYAKRLDGGGR